MKLIELTQPDFSFTDARGTITQLVHAGYAQVNAVFSGKGAVRGNFHYHKATKELFYVLQGKVNVQLRYAQEQQTTVFESGACFQIPELVRHRMEFLEDTYLVVLYTNCVERPDGTKDIFTD